MRAFLMVVAMGAIACTPKLKMPKIDPLVSRMGELERRVEILRKDVEASRWEASNAQERIDYYRDVLLIVSKTCPGRMKLPTLQGDPKKD